MTTIEQAEKLLDLAKQISHTFLEDGMGSGILEDAMGIQVVPPLFAELQKRSGIAPSVTYYPDKDCPSFMANMLVGAVKFSTCLPLPK